jgi:hypothetical protein
LANPPLVITATGNDPDSLSGTFAYSWTCVDSTSADCTSLITSPSSANTTVTGVQAGTSYTFTGIYLLYLN